MFRVEQANQSLRPPGNSFVGRYAFKRMLFAQDLPDDSIVHTCKVVFFGAEFLGKKLPPSPSKMPQNGSLSPKSIVF
jgi:hypothetical protein